MLVEYLGVTSEGALVKIDKPRGCHVRFSYLQEVYTAELQCARQANGDDLLVAQHKGRAMRAYLLYLIGTQIFVDTSVAYTNIMYMWFFKDFQLIVEWNWGVACLVYLYHKLS